MGLRRAVLVVVAAAAVAAFGFSTRHGGRGHVLTASASRSLLRGSSGAHASRSLQQLLDSFLASPSVSRLGRPGIPRIAPSVIGPVPRGGPGPLRGYSCPVRGLASPCRRQAHTVFITMSS